MRNLLSLLRPPTRSLISSPARRRSATTLSAIAGLALCISQQAFAQADVDLKQGWTGSDRDVWYSATQGSRLIPLDWLRALEQPGGAELFLAKENVEKFRYLPRTGSDLPVGFAVDQQPDDNFGPTKLRWKSEQSNTEKWVGMNCAACHSNEITFGTNRLRIEGAPTLADFQGFMETLNRALAETVDQSDKFGRFAARVLLPDDSPSNRELLHDAVRSLVAWQTKIDTMNKTELRYGFGRLDAFGHIFNKVALVVEASSPQANPSDAPVSYPFLWNAPQLDRVQWNGIARSLNLPSLGQPFDIGALSRNTGEVIGVFADITPVPGNSLSGYNSSVQVESLVSIEQMLDRLLPPLWPAVFGAPDSIQVAKGGALYEANCEACHAVVARTDLATKVKTVMSLFRATPTSKRTDPWMACNAYLDKSASGVLNGTPRDYFTGPPTPAIAQLADMLATTVVGVMSAQKGAVLKSAAVSFFGSQPPPLVIPEAEVEFSRVPTESLTLREQRLRKCVTDASDILGYKARPLTAIWATAPYLHNGSVPTLFDLLLPPELRPQQFWVGTREFDPVKVGFVTIGTPGNTFLFRTRDVNGAIIDGNSNLGHDYGNSNFSDDDRNNLIAYLKTL